ncbi:MAG: ribonuclease PH [Candidatus Aminicenantes bacterium]|nr:ribonuclease PH [Candidatus Aminicenantes bacterium]
MRENNRAAYELRPIAFVADYVRNVPGSVLCEQGNTRVVATATVEDRTPFFLRKSGQGWVTAEYAMLPGSSGNQRILRERGKINNRSGEIQRFIARALRTVLNLKEIGERTITLDADVIQADGSTRCASLNAGFLALILSLKYLVYEQMIADFPGFQFIAAVSIGVRDKEILVDLDYEEDSRIDNDINIVSNADGALIEVQSFCEGSPLSPDLFQKALALGIEKNLEIIAIQKKVLESVGIPF